MARHSFFTVDRHRAFFEGMKIELTYPYYPIVTLQSHARSRLSGGVSRHANNYFFNYNINLTGSEERFDAMIEMLLEERRKSNFREKPSRFQALFACESINEAVRFRDYSRLPPGTPIFEVNSTPHYHRGDMNLLNMNCTPVELSHRLDLYWQGETKPISKGYQPLWEVLIPLPVTIGEKANT
ncbi:DUF2441 domain-containing protein [Cedecea sp.]|jgi:hypothetical protein|uniref:DUF2441 domain-containing protein n=1 Tax=Cedecea sp. TaxID=1970739 RepID=UPI002F40EC8B